MADKALVNSPLCPSDADAGGGGGEEAVGDAEIGDGERTAPALLCVLCLLVVVGLGLCW